MVGALEGQGDSPDDSTTKLIMQLARHFDIDVRMYLQYKDIDRVEKFRKNINFVAVNKHRRNENRSQISGLP
jgi:hypothetical protein